MNTAQTLTRQDMQSMCKGVAPAAPFTAHNGQRMTYIGSSSVCGLHFAVPADKAAAWQQIIDE